LVQGLADKPKALYILHRGDTLRKEYDVAVIGAGVVGCAIARELSRFDLNICVLEKELDVSFGTSCRNSGVLHSGINYEPGTNRALMSVRGNSMMDALCAELKVPMQRIGKLTVALSEDDLPGLHRQRDQGKANGVLGMEMMNGDAMQKIQPGVAGILGLWTPTSAIISPYGLTIAFAENAKANGADFLLGSRVSKIKALPNNSKLAEAIDSGPFRHREGEKSRRVKFSPGSGFEISIEHGGKIHAAIVINAAGLHADEVSGMLGINAPRIWACRGEYYVLDKRLSGTLKTLVYPVPGPSDPGLGIHLTPTVGGNILIGPSADYIPGEDRENCRVTKDTMRKLREAGQRILPGLSASDFIRNFAGNRPKLSPPETGGNRDFVIEEAAEFPGFIQLLGIESPGLTSSPAIAEYVRDMIGARVRLRPSDFAARRPGFTGRFIDLPDAKRAEMASREPDYGEIMCRCELITKKEVRDAIENPLAARTLHGIKYRTRAMMGRCQGSFCITRIVRMLREEYGYKHDDFLLGGRHSRLFAGRTRQ
jgi:glycerol-3-phosphate dehydrogenase